MKFKLSNFIENFPLWHEKIFAKEKEKDFLIPVVKEIISIINNDNNSDTKATELVDYFQNKINYNIFVLLFDYNALESKLISNNFNNPELSNYLYMDFRKDLEIFENELKKSFENLIEDVSDSTIINIVDYLERNAVNSPNDKFVEDFTHINDEVLYLTIGSYLIWYLKNEGWNYKYFYKQYTDIHELIKHEIDDINSPEIDLNFTNEILSLIDFSNSDDYYNIFTVVDTYYKKQNGKKLEETFYTHNSEDVEKFKKFMTLASIVYIHSINIVDYLNDNDVSDIMDLFAKGYPFEESFDDEANTILYLFNKSYQDFVLKGNSFDIDSINKQNEEISKNAQNLNLNQLLVNLFQSIQELTNFFDFNKLDKESWKTLFNCLEFKELFETLYKQFYFTNNKKLRQYFVIQSKIDYSIF